MTENWKPLFTRLATPLLREHSAFEQARQRSYRAPINSLGIQILTIPDFVGGSTIAIEKPTPTILLSRCTLEPRQNAFSSAKTKSLATVSIGKSPSIA